MHMIQDWISQQSETLLMVHTELAGVPDHDVNELLCQLMKKCMTELLQIIDSFNSTKGRCFTQVEREVII